MRIIGPASAPIGKVQTNLYASSASSLFNSTIFPALWRASERYGIDPVGVLAQSLKETGWGQFTGRVNAQHYNTGGIKVRHLGYGGAVTLGDEQLAHAAFATWDVGAWAHVQHLRAYAGWPVSDGSLIVDPRYSLVLGKRLENFEELSGAWAPSPTYGEEIVVIARKLQA